MDLKHCLERVRGEAPLIHSITNYVTVNDVANILLACGASPIMADEPEEAADITALCGGLNLNLGTLNRHTIPAMERAGRRAAELGIPIVLDPVGAGASPLRTRTALTLMETIPFTVIRGNLSEIRVLSGVGQGGRGVDAHGDDRVTEDNVDGMAAFARAFAARHRCVAVITGAIDLVADGERCWAIRNGRPEMSRITGTGCQLSALIAAFAAANRAQPLEGAAAAVCLMGCAGEIAWSRMAPGEGNASYRTRIIDAVYHMTGAKLEGLARLEMR